MRLTGFGILVGVTYTIRTIQKSFFSGQPSEMARPAAGFEPISVPERIGAAVLMAATLLLGLYPAPLLHLIKSGFDSPLMSNLLKGGPS